MALPHVVGLDTGLVCTGLATAGHVMRTAKIGRTGITKLPLAARTAAIVDLGAAIVNQCYLSAEEMPGVSVLWRKPDLVVMEAPDVSNSFGGLVERIQLYHEVARRLVDIQVPFAIVPSAILKGYGTGNGGVDKGKKRVMAAVVATWPEYGPVNDDQADGAVLAAMGLDWLTNQRRVADGQAAAWLRRPSVQWPPNAGWVG